MAENTVISHCSLVQKVQYKSWANLDYLKRDLTLTVWKIYSLLRAIKSQDFQAIRCFLF